MSLLEDLGIKRAVEGNNQDFISTYFTPEKIDGILKNITLDDDDYKKSKLVEEFHNTFLRFACSSNAVSPSTMRLVLNVAQNKLNILPALFEHSVKNKKPTPLFFCALESAQVETLKVLVEEYLLRYTDCFKNMLLKVTSRYNPILAVCRTASYDNLKYLLEVQESYETQPACYSI